MRSRSLGGTRGSGYSQHLAGGGIVDEAHRNDDDGQRRRLRRGSTAVTAQQRQQSRSQSAQRAAGSGLLRRIATATTAGHSTGATHMSLSPGGGRSFSLFSAARASPGGAARASDGSRLGHDATRRGAAQRGATRRPSTREPTRDRGENARERARGGERERDGERREERGRGRENERARRGRDRESTMVGGRNKSARPPLRRASYFRPFVSSLGCGSLRALWLARSMRAANVTPVTSATAENSDEPPRRSATAEPMGGAGRKRERARERKMSDRDGGEERARAAGARGALRLSLVRLRIARSSCEPTRCNREP